MAGNGQTPPGEARQGWKEIADYFGVTTRTVQMWEAERGHMKAAQILTTLPAEYVGESTASEIEVAPGGRFVYCSNRGYDSVAIFGAAGGAILVHWGARQIVIAPNAGRHIAPADNPAAARITTDKTTRLAAKYPPRARLDAGQTRSRALWMA